MWSRELKGMNTYSKPEEHNSNNQETDTTSKMIIYCATFLENSLAETKELPRNALTKLNFFDKSYIHNNNLFMFVNPYEVICSLLYHSVSSIK